MKNIKTLVVAMMMLPLFVSAKALVQKKRLQFISALAGTSKIRM